MQGPGIVGPDGIGGPDNPQLIFSCDREYKTQGAIPFRDEAMNGQFHRSDSTDLSPSLRVRLWIGLIQFGDDAFNT